MSRGLGTRQRQVLAALRMHHEVYAKLGVSREETWASLTFLADAAVDGPAWRSEVESTRRALKSLAALGQVELSYEWRKSDGRGTPVNLVARLSVEPSYDGTKLQHLDTADE